MSEKNEKPNNKNEKGVSKKEKDIQGVSLKNLRIAFVSVLGLLLVTYFWFICDLPVFQTGRLEIDSWLIFWGSFLAFCGTMFLGTFAYYESKKANKIADEAKEVSKNADVKYNQLIDIEKNRHSCNIILYSEYYENVLREKTVAVRNYLRNHAANSNVQNTSQKPKQY